ncbi:hypothetical protein LCGC14_2546650, partial [marine sediment metagenome]
GGCRAVGPPLGLRESCESEEAKVKRVDVDIG